MENLPETTAENGITGENQNESNWDRNQSLITGAILKFINDNGSMPTMSHIAKATGLNRKTVQKHTETGQKELFEQQNEFLGLVANHVKARVLRSALKGDNQAAKIFLESTGKLRPAKEGAQNNYIQINKTTINQHVIQQLKPEELLQIEEIIAGGLKQKEE